MWRSSATKPQSSAGYAATPMPARPSSSPPWWGRPTNGRGRSNGWPAWPVPVSVDIVKTARTLRNDALLNERDWNAEVIAEFRANRGEVEAPYDDPPPMLLLHTVGAR